MPAERNTQLALALRLATAPTLQDFLPADAAAPLALRAALETSQRSAILLSGPSGAGKTHLLRALIAAAAQQGCSAAYLPLRVLGADAAGMLDAQPACDWLAVDDLDAVAGIAEAELALFGLHNRQRDAAGSVAYSSTAPLEQLPVDLPDLRSRLAQSVRLGLPTSDDAQRRAIVQQQAVARGLHIDDPALDYLLNRVGRDLHGLMAWVERIDRESLAAQRRVTVPFLRALLGQS